MIFNTFNWIALIFLVISFAYTNAENYRNEIKELKEELEDSNRLLSNTDKKFHALDKMISGEGYRYSGGISSTDYTGSYVEYRFYDLKRVEEKESQGE